MKSTEKIKSQQKESAGMPVGEIFNARSHNTTSKDCDNEGSKVDHKHHFSAMPVYSMPVIQPKLSVNKSGDKYEQEADHIAEKVMRMNETSVIVGNGGDDEKYLPNTQLTKNIAPVIQTKGESEAIVSNSLNNKISASAGSGNEMDRNTQSFMSDRFGADFSKVNIHANEESEQMNSEINARAFTVGNDIYFNRGEYQPGSSKGKHLLAHELSHVLQQNGGNKKIQKDDPAPDAAALAETKKIADLITKIKAFGIIGVENADANFTSAELELVNKALSGLPANDKASIKGAKIVRVKALAL